MRTLHYLKKNEDIKKLPSKVADLYIIIAVWIFFAAPTAQNSPELKIHIRYVAQDTSVS